MDTIESSSSSFSVLSTESSASLQLNSMKTITTEAEQHDPDVLNTMNIQSGGSPETCTDKPLIPIPGQTSRSSDRSAADTLLVTFQSDPSHSEAFTSDGKDSPKTTTCLGLLNLASDLLPIVTETGPPAIGSESPHIPSVLTTVDDMLSEIDMDTVRPLDLIMTLGTTAASLVATLPASVKYIDVSIPTGWSSPNQEDSLDQEAGSAAHIKPLQAQGSDQSLSTSYTTHRLSHQQPAMAAPTQAVNVSSGNWQRVSVTRTPAKPLSTPLGSLSTITEGESVLIASSMPSVLNQDDGGRLLPPSSTPSSQSRNFAKTEEICNSGLSGTRPARLMEENRLTSKSVNMAPEKPAVTINTPTVPHLPEWRPSVTTTSDTMTSSVNTNSLLDQLQRARLISRQNVGIATGMVFAGAAVFILTCVLHCLAYWWVSRQRTGMIWIGREPNTNTGSRIELPPRRPQNPEVSYFSDSS
ncbi:hypothetical protein BDW59DRAFT_172167 [Aspergillus cavernicola]|uniref:Mid2 domain-containing protein n=1 Tax=Aspergillus cavernicola TaxID=176166 RepID=A0ABR4IDI4_9EURO